MTSKGWRTEGPSAFAVHEKVARSRQSKEALALVAQAAAVVEETGKNSAVHRGHSAGSQRAQQSTLPKTGLRLWGERLQMTNRGPKTDGGGPEISSMAP